MIGYTTLGTNDLEKSEKFYNELFEVLDIKQLFKTDRMIAWGVDFNSVSFIVTIPYDEGEATVGNGTMIAIKANSKEIVDALYEKSLQLGAKDEGAAGDRGKNFYGAYIRDLDGNKLNFHYTSY